MREPTLPFKKQPIWLQEINNQRTSLDYFYHAVEPNRSLCLIYAKQVPFIEDSRRIIMGIGYVTNYIPSVEYNHDDTNDFRATMWEGMICHSIREDCSNGFLFPYHELMTYAEEHPDFNIRSATVVAPDEYREEFSYKTEHVSYDAVIDVLLQTKKVLSVIQKVLPNSGPWKSCQRWVDQRLQEVWLDRGAFPGLGVMLIAAGFNLGLLMAEELKIQARDGDTLSLLDKAMAEPEKYFSSTIQNHLRKKKMALKAFQKLNEKRKNFFNFMTRFAITRSQAKTIYRSENREKIGLFFTDEEIINNPYVLYEETRDKSFDLRISISTIDMAMFPLEILAQKFPINMNEPMTTDDERRIRALSVYILEQMTEVGHTVYPRSQLILRLNDMPLQQPCQVNGDIFDVIEDFLSKEIFTIPMKDSKPAYQLQRLHEMDDLIRRIVSKKMHGARHNIVENWDTIINNAFGTDVDDVEKKVREEKAAILKEISEARISVLLGGAGTGKTTLLSLLGKSKSIQLGGILLLAPTGKARVKLEQAMSEQNVKCTAMTVAQYLLKNDRYDEKTMTYKLSDLKAKNIPDTVIIDEASMLTEEMFAAILQTVGSAKRIIFVGDGNQLPPIGAGRPFVDLIRHLKNNLSVDNFPKVGNCYGELTITRRNQGSQSNLLAECFTADGMDQDYDILTEIQTNSQDVEFKRWSTPDELEQLILETLADELDMNDINDIEGFNRSLGATIKKNYSYFNLGCADSAENWQILAPVRNNPHGVININHLIHQTYRRPFIDLATSNNRKIPKPMGPEEIVYGDKVINLQNQKQRAFSTIVDKPLSYVANGEIGMAGIIFGVKNGDYSSLKYLKIEYCSQPNVIYSYTEDSFGEESEAILELAYALTVHKAQGSEFNKVILVLSEPCRLLSRELFYTAITRQVKKLVILYNEEIYHLKNYMQDNFSDIAQRFTNLFAPPHIVEFDDKYFEEDLIHRTARGEMVRSKSEVIIANALYHRGIDYEYEKDLWIGDTKKIPDFTIEDVDSGKTIYWEHCGLLEVPKYRKRWEAKKQFYEANGIVENDNLIVTCDKNGSIDSQEIERIIDEFFG